MSRADAIPLPVRPATAAALAPYGTLIEPGEDGTPWGPADARLLLSAGTPRLYIMTLQRRPLRVVQITRHRRVTQSLAALQGQPWILVLAPPGDPDDPQALPDPSCLAAFRFSGRQAFTLHRGCWHAGPLFDADTADFINLELADTNETDHQSVRLPSARTLEDLP